MATEQEERAAIAQVRTRGLATHNDVLTGRWVVAGVIRPGTAVQIAMGDSVHDALRRFDEITEETTVDEPEPVG